MNRYGAFAAAAGAIGIGSIAGLWITHDTDCLLILWAEWPLAYFIYRTAFYDRSGHK